MFRKKIARVAMAGALALTGLGVIGGAVMAADSLCRPTSPREDHYGYNDLGNLGVEGPEGTPTVYNGSNRGRWYTGICSGDAFVEVRDPAFAAGGSAPVLVFQTGQDAVDTRLWGDGNGTVHGPASVYIGEGQPTGYGCAEGADTVYGYSNGNNVTNSLPSVYLDDKGKYQGICGGDEAYLQVNDVNGAAAGKNALLEGQTGEDAVDDQLWAYGPAEVWLDRGPESPNGPGCAPAKDYQYGYSNGNNVTRELPTVYTGPDKQGGRHVGICGGGADGQKLEVDTDGNVTTPAVPAP